MSALFLACFKLFPNGQNQSTITKVNLNVVKEFLKDKIYKLSKSKIKQFSKNNFFIEILFYF
jgi:hypothetical protein